MMNIERLKQAEKRFFTLYPLGFESDDLKVELKKHKMDKMIALANDALSKENLLENEDAVYDILTLITRASIVSVFEKTAFRNVINDMDTTYHKDLVDQVYTMIHVNEKEGFEGVVSLLSPYKAAKWPVLSALLGYYRPDYDVFIKPTTVKKVIETYELQDITYSATLNYEFYQKYRAYFNQMRQLLDPRLSITNGHFSGFLMMSL
jgi:hypothetical protein